LVDLLDVPFVTLKTGIYRRNIGTPVTAEQVRRFLQRNGKFGTRVRNPAKAEA
jgi:hypothetical protein